MTNDSSSLKCQKQLYFHKEMYDNSLLTYLKQANADLPQTFTSIDIPQRSREVLHFSCGTCQNFENPL